MQGKSLLNELHRTTDPDKNIQGKWEIYVERTTQKDRFREKSMQGKFMLNELHRKTDPEKNIQGKFMLNELHRKTDSENK